MLFIYLWIVLIYHQVLLSVIDFAAIKGHQHLTGYGSIRTFEFQEKELAGKCYSTITL